LGSKVRVTAQLTDAVNGPQLWSEPYHRDVDDMFALPEEIAQAIGASLDIELRLAEGDHAHSTSKQVGVWDMFQKGMWHFFKYSDDDTLKATTQLRQLIEKVPSFAPAHATLALLATRQVLFGEAQDIDELIERASYHATAAVACDDRNSYAHMALARVLILQGDLERAMEQARTAIDLNPNSSGARLTLAHVLLWQGNPEEALSAVDFSIRLSPRGPLRDFKHTARAVALYQLDRLDEAEMAARTVVNGNRFKFGGLLVLSAILARQGRLDEAREASQQLTQLRPDATISWVDNTWRGLNPDFRERFGQDLREANLPL
jgi:tetratricopeptide (TPR) repeat protein